MPVTAVFIKAVYICVHVHVLIGGFVGSWALGIAFVVKACLQGAGFLAKDNIPMNSVRCATMEMLGAMQLSRDT